MSRDPGSVTASDAILEISVSPDGMTATVSSYAPPLGGSALDEILLLKALDRAGVNTAPDSGALELLQQTLAQGGDVTGLAVAHGEPPVPAEDSRLEAEGDLAYPVWPGQLIGRVRPKTEARAGRDLRGQVLPAPAGPPPKEMAIPAQGGCLLDPRTYEVKAAWYGLVAQDGNILRLTSLLEIAPDKMKVTGKLYPRNTVGEALTGDVLVAGLEALRVKAPPAQGAIDIALSLGRHGGDPVDGVIVARGIQPKDGEDGRFEPAFRNTAGAGTIDESGRMDYYERGGFHAVREGDALGRVLPPERGRHGMDVFGALVRAADGQPAEVVRGENVAVSADGQEFRASISGVVVWARNTVSVTELLIVGGDLNIAVGNVNLERGSTLVKGSVHSGLTLAAPGNIDVLETIQNAKVMAGGDLTVNGGIFMNKGGWARAGGSIKARFALNATLEADGDIDVANEMIGCVAKAGGRILAMRGEGVIVGGNLSAGLGLEAKEIGSEMNEPTTVVLGLPPRRDEALLTERRELKTYIAKITGAVGEGEPLDILKRTPENRRKAVAEIIKARLRAEARLKEIESRLESDMAELRRNLRVTMRVSRLIYPGVIVVIAGRVFEVKTPIPRARIYFDTDTDTIQPGPY